MFDNVLPESVYIEELYGEYLTFVNRYQNLRRASIFGKYLNINKAASGYDDNVKSTFDRYESGVQYDIYDYTPFFYTAQVINEGQNVPDLKGQMFQGSLNLIIYTINEPRIEDLVIFNRPPQKGVEIFRVDHIRASINAMASVPNANWFELTLDYAPLVNLDKLNYLNHYAYSLPMQKYIYASDFYRQVKETEHMNKLFYDFYLTCFDYKNELYFYLDHDNNKIAPLYENKLIYNFLALKNQYQDHFNNIPRPFGIKSFKEPSGYLNLNTQNKEEWNLEDSFDFVETILYQTEKINVFQAVHLIGLWIWDRDRILYPEYKPPENGIYPNLSKKSKNGLNSNNTFCNNPVGLMTDVSKLPINTFKD